MLNEFALVGKRAVLRNEVPVDEMGNWEGHMIMTLKKTPSYIFLDVEKLRRDGISKQMIDEIWAYIS